MSLKATASVTTFRFDRMATLINDRVDNPAESGVERYVGLEHLDADSLRIRRWGEITDVESTKLRFQPGDIIFGKRRVYQRKLAVADFEGICSAHAMVLRAKENVVLPEFLPFFMQSDRFMERALAISVGSLSPTINWTTLAAEECALPPIEEQRRIAQALAATSAVVDALEYSRDQARKLYESALHMAFPMMVTRTKGETTDSSVPLGSVCEVRASGVDKHSREGEREARLCNYLDVYRNGIIHSKMSFMKATATEREIERYALRRGDVIITKDSEEPTDIAVPARVAEDMHDVLCGYHLAILRPDAKLIDSVYLTHCLRAPASRVYFSAVAQGISRFGLTVDAIRSMPVPVRELKTQAQTGQRLESLFECLGLIGERIGSARGYQRSIRETLLSGGVR